MVWQDVFPNVGPKLDAEHERELRLVEQARAGADWALAALIARYQPPVTRYLTRLTGSPTKARILAEQVFIRMERRLHGSQGGRQLRLWLLRACTEAGLEMLRGPREAKSPRLVESRRPVGLLPSGNSPAVNFLRAGLGKLATVTGSTSRQVRKLIWADLSESERRSPHAHRSSDYPRVDRLEPIAADGEGQPEVDEVDTPDPREALRHRMVRAVLAELPYGDAQCLALHLVAGLNQAEVALALGITASATRRRIVHGLTLFAQRYAAAAASLGLPLDFFETQAEVPARDGARIDGAERPMPMVEALADALEVDPLTTNKHIAVHPFGDGDGALIWNGRILDEMAPGVNDSAMKPPVEAEPLIVETSLAHVGEPEEVPEPVAALPPPPAIPLTVRDVWVETEAYASADADIAHSFPLTLDEIVLPISVYDGESQWQVDGAPRHAQVVNDVSAPSDSVAGAWNAVEANASIEARVVPVLTASMAFEAPHDVATSAEYSEDRVDSRESGPASILSGHIDMGRDARVVPVLTTAQPASDMAFENLGEARVVPVLTASLSSDRVTPAHMLNRGEETNIGSDAGAGIHAADAERPTAQPQVALAGRSGTAGEITSETL
ncbi:MAG: RNA polymerase sigma factor [Ktedonobacterales bacterium]